MEFWYAISRYALLRLETQAWHVKNWRPNIIVFTGQPHNREQLVEVSDWLSLGRGVVTFFQLIIRKNDPQSESMLRDTAYKHIRNYITEHDMEAFAEADIVPNFRHGAAIVAQAHGIGAFNANTILMGWSNTIDGCIMQIHLTRDLIALHKSVIFLHHNPEQGFGNRQLINVWWKGRGGNADLMLLLVHFIRQHPSWRGATVRLLRMVDNEEAIESTREHMNQLLDEVRVIADPIVIIRDEPHKRLGDVIRERNLAADLTLLGMYIPPEEETIAYAERLSRLVEAAGSVLLVRNAEPHKDLLTAE